MLKLVDTLLIILAAFCLFRYAIDFSESYLTAFDKFVPQLFIDSAPVRVGSTFHLFFSGLLTGLLLARYASRPVMTALLVSLLLYALEIYQSKLVLSALFEQVTAQPKMLLELIKPLVMLTMLTFLLTKIKATEEPIENAHEEHLS